MKKTILRLSYMWMDSSTRDRNLSPTNENTTCSKATETPCITPMGYVDFGKVRDPESDCRVQMSVCDRKREGRWNSRRGGEFHDRGGSFFRGSWHERRTKL